MKVGIIGAKGYVGEELTRLLSKHPKVKDLILCSREKGTMSQFYPSYQHHDYAIQPWGLKDLIEDKVDVIFMATPHKVAMDQVKKAYKNQVKIIDMGAGFRLQNTKHYKTYYNLKHPNPDLLSEAVYGLCEFNREDLKKAWLIANPGCYVTASLLGVLPSVETHLIKDSIIIDAKSGVSGAGRSLSQGTHYSHCSHNVKAYGVHTHRHKPEILEQIQSSGLENATLQFTPHLIPMNRGILSTIYCQLEDSITEEAIREMYKERYKDEPFVHVLEEGQYPNTMDVRGSNYCHMNVFVEDKNLIIVSCIDNLVKGAAGQGVQNMNLMMGIDEQSGLTHMPLSL